MLNVAKYIVIPYVFMGSDFSGCDCYGLVRLWYREELGIELVDFNHGRASSREFVNSNYFAESAHLQFERVEVGASRTHDVVLIRSQSQTPNHCGIVVEGLLLHTMERVGCTTARLKSWGKYIAGVYRYRGLNK